MSRVTDAFNLRLEAAATPERVAAAAAFLSRVLQAAHPDLPDGSVTIVVTNFAMGTHVRPRTHEGLVATRRILDFLDNPSRTLDRDPKTRDIAVAFAHVDQTLQAATISRPRARKPVATLDDAFARRMGALASTARPESTVRGTTVVYSPVYRVGRWDEDAATKARIRVDGECHDIALAKDSNDTDFYNAAAHKRPFPIYLNAVWMRGGDGRLRYELKSTRVIRVDLSWTPLTGEEFVAAVNDSASLGYGDDDEFEERVALIRQRRV